MKLGLIITFLAFYFFLHGLWRLYCVRMYKQAYKLFKNKGESFLDFLDRELDSWGTNLAVMLGLHWWYNSKLYSIIQILLGVLQVVLGVGLFILLFKVNQTDFKLYLDIKL